MPFTIFLRLPYLGRAAVACVGSSESPLALRSASVHRVTGTLRRLPGSAREKLPRARSRRLPRESASFAGLVSSGRRRLRFARPWTSGGLRERARRRVSGSCCLLPHDFRLGHSHALVPRGLLFLRRNLVVHRGIANQLDPAVFEYNEN